MAVLARPGISEIDWSPAQGRTFNSRCETQWREWMLNDGGKMSKQAIFSSFL